MKKRVYLALLSVAALAAPIATTTPAHATAAQGVCDIYAAAGTPCVAANSTTRALFAAYNGPLYTVTRSSDGSSLVINTVAAGGVADSAAQDAFCSGTACKITDIADQTPYNNDLAPAGKGGYGGPDVAAVANKLPVYLNGQKAYGVDVTEGVGYADDYTWNIPTGQQPEGEYMLASGSQYNNGCCFDYGNAETNRLDNGAGHMEAVYYGGVVGADMENGVFSGTLPDLSSPFVSGFLKSDQVNTYTMAEGNGQSGGLSVSTEPLSGAYSPMNLEGGMVLGVGGDISSNATGYFFEGAITQGQPTASADAAVQANIVAAGYSFSGPVTPPPPSDPYIPLVVDGQFGPATTSAVEYADGSTVNGLWNSASIIGMQKHLGMGLGGQTGVFGPVTIRTLQKHLGMGRRGQTGVFGPVTITNLQKALNAGTY